jgi:cytochrome c oxidase assembly protein subunit 15
MVAAPLSFEAPISAPTEHEEHARLRPVRRWLLALILLVFTMVLVGGATRLTESGLSITEWNLVSGTLPPLSEEVWQAEFDLYRQSPQYELLNRGMSLQDFKTIYGWEWAHRELGRFIGLVYIAGFLWFAARRVITGQRLLILAAMGVLLGTQGIVGWIMVASGLQPGMTAVAPVKLTLHLVLASLLFAALTAMFVRLGGAEREVVSPAVKRASGLLVLLAFVQIALGGLMAGHDAGLTYNTWPLMDGRFVPRGLARLDPWWLNVFDSIATIQFNHRLGAYVVGAAILAYAVAVRSHQAVVRERALIMAAFVIVQIALGIAVLLVQVPPLLALAHQGSALILLFVLVWNAATLRTPSPA